MPGCLEILCINHINHLTTDYDASLAHYEDLLGGQFLMKIGFNNYTDGCLIDVGGEIVELLIPKILEKAEGRQLTKLGPHYSSIELYVPNLAEAKEAVVGRGIRLLMEGRADFFTLGADTEGIVLQVFDGNWHREPRPPSFVHSKRPVQWWTETHPIGYTGLKHVSFATDDLDRSLKFWTELTGGQEMYRADRPTANARAIGIDIGIPVELIAPVGDGRVSKFIETYGTKLRATTFGVRDLAKTEAYFASKGYPLVPGDIPDSLMLTAEQNRGAILQFME